MTLTKWGLCGRSQDAAGEVMECCSEKLHDVDPDDDGTGVPLLCDGGTPSAAVPTRRPDGGRARLAGGPARSTAGSELTAVTLRRAIPRCRGSGG